MTPERQILQFLLAAIVAFCMVLACQPARAMQIVPRWALEKNASNVGAGNAERLYSLEALFPISDAQRLKVEGGGWLSRQSDRQSMYFISASWGYRAQLPLGGVFFEAFVGPAWVSRLDARQSSHIQIKHDLGVGWTDAKGWGLGLGYSHLSNAGIAPPNLGRDFLGMRFLLPL